MTDYFYRTIDQKMILGKYIKQLLDERKRVILPGFGNLEVKESSAGVAAEEGRFDPPGSSVRFDAGYSKDDGLLASVLAAGEGLATEEAGQQVLELVDAIKFALDKGESFAIPWMGTMVRDSDGKVHFRKDPSWLLDPDQYGLDSMDLLVLDESWVDVEETPVPETITVETPKEAISSKPEKATPDWPVIKTSGHPAQPRPATKTDRPGRRWRIIWIVTGSLVIILLALIFIPEDTLRRSGKKVPAGVQGTEMQDGAGEAGGGETQRIEPSLDGPPVLEEMEREEIPARQDAQPEVQDRNYLVVAGSFSHLKNASDLQDQLIARGYPAEVMITENRMYRVIVASYATKDEAERNLNAMKSEPGLGSCWLLSN